MEAAAAAVLVASLKGPTKTRRGVLEGGIERQKNKERVTTKGGDYEGP